MTTASAVSRILRAEGFGVVTSRLREGLHVSRGYAQGLVTVTVQIDAPGERSKLTFDVAAFLCGEGFKVERDENILTVSK